MNRRNYTGWKPPDVIDSAICATRSGGLYCLYWRMDEAKRHEIARVLLADNGLLLDFDSRETLNESGFQPAGLDCAAAAFDAADKDDDGSDRVTDIDLGSGPEGFDVASRARAARLRRYGARRSVLAKSITAAVRRKGPDANREPPYRWSRPTSPRLAAS